MNDGDIVKEGHLKRLKVRRMWENLIFSAQSSWNI